jgi:LPXTG-motif cell wall-anchored protein
LVEELDVRVRTGSGPWGDGPRSTITDLRPGEELPIGIRVELDPDATNASQLRTARLGVAVFLSATEPGEDGGSGPAAGGPDALPRTGANLLALTIAAVAAVLAGSMLLLLRERRERRPRRDEAGP